MSKICRVRRWAQGCALALASTAFAEGSPQCLLDLVVTHVQSEGGPLLVGADLAAELQQLRPADPPDAVRRAEIGAWLSTIDVALTSTPSGGWIVYRPGSALARSLLQYQAPWVEQNELARRGQDLVWTVDPPEGGEKCGDGLVEVRLGDHRVVGGPAHLIRAGAGPSDPVELLPTDGPPQLPGMTVGEWVTAYEAGDEQRIVTYDKRTAELFDEYLLWGVDDPEDALRLGVARRVGEDPIEVLQVELDRLESPGRRRLSGWGTRRHVRHLGELNDLHSDNVDAVVHLECLDPRQVATALNRMDLGPDAMASAGSPKALILHGRAASVRAWWIVLERLDRLK